MTRARAIAFAVAGFVLVLGLAGGAAVTIFLKPDPAEVRVFLPSGNTPPPPLPPAEQYAHDRLSVMSLEERLTSMFMVHAPGTDPGSWAAVAATGVGGMIVMGDNIPAPEDALAELIAAGSGEPGLPLLFAIDQEGGIVARLSDPYASAAELRFADPAAAQDAFAGRAALLAALGVDINLGVVADVTADPGSFIYWRTLGDDPQGAAARVAAAVAGESGVVLSTLKHFPGHGVSPGDSHSAIPGTAMGVEEWEAGHLPPFQAGIDAGAELVMFGHLRFDAIDAQPATLSALWHEVLREQLGFDGVIITDDLAMLEYSGEAAYSDRAANAVAAVAAGNTMLLYVAPVDVPAIVGVLAAAVRDGSLDDDLVDEAALRLLELRRTLSGETGRYSHCLAACQELVR